MTERARIRFDEHAQAELAARLLEEGINPDDHTCRSCGAIYDGGQFCTYCGDANPLDDAEEQALLDEEDA